MKQCNLRKGWLVAALGAVALSVSAQSINLWRGNETGANWSDAYKWKLKHVPTGSEAVHFRQDHSVIIVNSTVDLSNGMQLYGQELSLEGHGNINLRSPVPHQSTVYIPASAAGYANLTLNDTLAFNGQFALAAKSFGTSSGKGSVTLKDRSTITGKLSIGNNGSGSGQVFIRDQSVYRISALELNTLAEKGGAAELHIFGGTVQFEKGTQPFESFLADPSRKIILGDYGTLHIDSNLPIQRKKEMLLKMIQENHLVAAQGCTLNPPIFKKNMIMIKAEHCDNNQPSNNLLAQLKSSSKSKEKNDALKSLTEQLAANTPNHATEDIPADTVEQPKTTAPSSPIAGYIVFFSAILFFLRPAKRTE